MTRYESHPGKLLREHLKEVAEGARARLDHPALRRQALLREVAWLIGLSHDIGKYTSYFQAHLHEEVRFPQGLERHAFPSAVFAAWLLQRRLPRLPEADEPLRDFLPLLGYLVVHRHHGHLRAPEELIPRSRELKGWPELGRLTGELRRALAAFQEQLRDLCIHRAAILPELEALGVPETSEFFELEVYDLFCVLERLNYRLEEGELPEGAGARLCLWGQLLFSALVDADKFSAAGVAPIPRAETPATLVDEHLHEKFPEPRHALDRARQEFYELVQTQVDQLPLKLGPEEPQALSLTAPTGLGKTLTALSAALRLRAHLRERWGSQKAPRIIYALPFINLIEQNYQVFEEVFRRVPGFSRSSERFLLRHHHLAEIRYRHECERPVEEALLLTEAWEGEAIVTTFVQLFHTLLGYENRSLKKLHNLIGALVILDEPQGLPMEYWGAIGDVLKTLMRELGITTLQMTATRPLIFSSPRELHPESRKLFGLQQRTVTEIELEERTVEELADEVEDLAHESSVLIVVNTIRSSLELYEQLRQRGVGEPFRCLPFEGDRALIYLSTNIVPSQRRERLEFLKGWLQQGNPVVVVATQVVEAGVDLDFPVVIRDLGPLEAIVQVAGRCNREGKLPQGRVLLRPLKDAGTAQVYGAIHLHTVRKLLQDHPHQKLEEPDYGVLVERYFQEVQACKSQQTSRELWRAYTRLWYDWTKDVRPGPALSDFSLIPQRPEVPIFIALSPEEERWFHERFVPEVLKSCEFSQRQRAYLRYKARLHDGMIRPLLQRVQRNLPPQATKESTLRWVPHGQLEDFYSLETGFRWRSEELPEAWIE
jgi:CRISPR-associated endonuclease/helicase Cas3